MTRDELQELARAALGLGESDSFKEVVSEPLAAGRGGHGLTVSEEQPLDDALIARAFQSADFDTLGRLPWPPFRFRARRWAEQPGIFFLEDADELVPVAGLCSRLQAGAYAVDSRSTPAFFFLAAGDRDYALSLYRGDLFLEQVERVPSAGSLVKMAPWRPPASSLPVALPETQDLLQGESCPHWLQREAGILERSPSIVDRLAAVGMVLRLWSPPPGGRAAEMVRGLLENRTPTLSSRVRAALADVPAQVLREAEHLAVLEADLLGEKVEDVQTAVAGRNERASSLLGSLVLRRDDLESVLAVLRLRGAGQDLGEALSTVDGLARHCLYAFSLLPAAAGGDRLRTVAWKEPLAWWASLAGT